MPSVDVEHVRRRSGQDQERTEVSGRVTVAGRTVQLNPGTFGLRAVSLLKVGQSQDNPGTMVVGSARPNAIGSSVKLRSVMAGSDKAGSPSGGGSVTAPFTAYGF